MRKLKVLSLFDGISCGQLALQRAEIPVEIYFASEVDKYAIKLTQKNFPNTIQMGDVNNICWESLGQIDLLIGGSPCQDLSIAKKDRKGLDGERSGLFFKYVEALRVLKPKYFLLENVASMKEEERNKISEILGVEPILINSALVSAQQRKRLYWTNIPNLEQPSDKCILLKDILESGIGCNVSKQGKNVDKFSIDKSNCLMARDYKGFGNQAMTGVIEPCGIIQTPHGKNNGGLHTEKAPTMTASSYEHNNHVVAPIKIGQIGKGGQGQRIYSVLGKSVSLNANGGGARCKDRLISNWFP